MQSVIKNLKNNKAQKCDNLTNEDVKEGGKELTKKLQEIFNEILKTNQIPQIGKHSNIILLYKKRNPHKIENCRPISISSNEAKTFSKIIEKRLRNTLTMQYSKEQAGFRSSYSTIDHLHTINQLLEKSKEHAIEIHLAFIDFRKAFDTLEHRFLFNVLKNQGVEPHLIDIIKQLYTNIKARIVTNKMGNFFTIKRDVKQGDSLSPLLFIYPYTKFKS